MGVDNKIEIINNEEYPSTLRTVQLNMLPALVIDIINRKKLGISTKEIGF